MHLFEIKNKYLDARFKLHTALTLYFLIIQISPIGTFTFVHM